MFLAPPYGLSSEAEQELDARIAAAVETFSELKNKLDEAQVSTTNVELALHQLEALKSFTWGGLDPLVRHCLGVTEILPRGSEMHPEHLEESLDIACEEYIVKGHRLILRRWLDNKPVSLSDLAREVYADPESKNFGNFRKRLRKNVLYPMRDIGLWNHVEGEKKKSKSGALYHPGFIITPGPVLVAFHRHIYIPWSKRHAEFTSKLLASSKRG